MVFSFTRPYGLLSLICSVSVVYESAGAQDTVPPVAVDNAPSAVENGGDEDLAISKLNAQLTARLKEELQQIPEVKADDPRAVDLYSRRGDLHMFLGKFTEAEKDYQQMVVLQPALDTSHWRLGIAMYFAGHPKEAAEQFDKYHTFDNVDRENGIWRYLSHRAAYGKDQARQQLLKYEKDDRPPFREVYQLFEDRMTASEVLSAIPEDITGQGRASRLFYSHLYIGLNSSVEGDRENALLSLRKATLNEWPRDAGFGPAYMWHIGRLQYLQLMAQDEKQQSHQAENQQRQKPSEE